VLFVAFSMGDIGFFVVTWVKSFVCFFFDVEVAFAVVYGQQPLLGRLVLGFVLENVVVKRFLLFFFFLF